MAEAAVVFVFGLIVGSFLNAVIYRLGSGDSLFEKSSKCPKCGHPLAWPDLVPVVSFFMLSGKCRYCRKPISIQYPLVELTTALSFVLIYAMNVIPAEAGIQFILTDLKILFQWIFVSFLTVIFVYDLKHYLILDKVVFPAAALALLYQVYTGNWRNALLGAGMLAGFFLLLFVISRGRWIGAGDIKLGIFLGLLVPFPETVALFFLAYFLGAIVALPLVIFKAKQFGDKVPFGTFLTCAAFIAMLKGEVIITWYLTIIGIR